MNTEESTPNSGEPRSSVHRKVTSGRETTKRMWIIHAGCCFLFAFLTISLAPVCRSEICGYAAGATMLLFAVAATRAAFGVKLLTLLRKMTVAPLVLIQFFGAFIIVLIVIYSCVWVLLPLSGHKVLPFEIRGFNSVDGAAVADALVGEFQRIRQIYENAKDTAFPASVRLIKTEPTDRYLTRVSDIGSLQKQLPAPELKQFGFSQDKAPLDKWASDLGSVGIGDYRLPLGGMLLAIKRQIHAQELKERVTGIVVKNGNSVRLIATVEKPIARTWEVSGELRGDDSIASLIRDLSYNIANTHADSTRKQPWSAFKHTTEALDAYLQYCKKESPELLEAVHTNCVAAINTDRSCSLVPELLHNISVFYINRGEVSKAVESASVAYELSKASDSARLYIDALLNNHNPIEAMSICREAIKADPKYDMLHERLAQCLMQIQEYDEAITEYKLAQACNPNQHAHYTMLGKLFARLRRYTEALGEYNRAITVDPHCGYQYYLVGEVHQAKGNYDEAIAEYRRGIEKEGQQQGIEGLLRLALIYDDLGKYDLALEQCALALRINPKATQARIIKGRTLRHMGRNQEAVRIYKNVIKVDSNNCEAHRSLAVLYRQDRDYEHAIREFRLAIDCEPRYSTPHRGLALVYLKKRDVTMAEQELIKASDLNDEEDADPYGEFDLGVLRHQQNRIEEGRGAWRHAALLFKNETVRDRLYRGLCMTLVDDPHGMKELRSLVSTHGMPRGYRQDIMEIIETLPQNVITSPRVRELQELLTAASSAEDTRIRTSVPLPVTVKQSSSRQ